MPNHFSLRASRPEEPTEATKSAQRRAVPGPAFVIRFIRLHSIVCGVSDVIGSMELLESGNAETSKLREGSNHARLRSAGTVFKSGPMYIFGYPPDSS